MTETFESIFIEIKTRNNGNIIVGELYRPPNANPVEFVELLNDLLSNNYFTNKTCFVMGDFNINLLNCNDNPLCQDFLNLMLSKLSLCKYCNLGLLCSVFYFIELQYAFLFCLYICLRIVFTIRAPWKTTVW